MNPSWPEVFFADDNWGIKSFPFSIVVYFEGSKAAFSVQKVQFSWMIFEYFIGTKSRVTSRLLVPATFSFLILRDNKSPRLFVFEFCVTINPRDF